MTVQCPRCRTQYKIPSARISDPRPVFKCTRCSLVFSSDAERGPRGTARAKEDNNLPLPFSSRTERARGEEGDDVTRAEEHSAADEDDEVEFEDDGAGKDEESAAEDAAEEEEEDEELEPARRAPRAARPREKLPAPKEPIAEPAFVARASRERDQELERKRAKEIERAAPPRRGNGRRDELSFRRDEDEDEGPTTDVADEDEEARGPVLSASAGKQRRPPINPRRGIRSATATTGPSPLRTVTIGVAAIALVYLALAVALERRPEAAFETLGRVPLLGRLLGGDHLLVWRLQLADVDGGLDQIKGGRAAYVVTGRALNTTNEDLRVIEIEGRLLVNGVEQRRQTVYAANQQRKTIQDLSPSEVEMLLRLEPNRRFVIHPGESASFLLVFPNPPPGATEVTCRVLDARAT
jgi:predicted Zn finger-like uncharacterized protein